MMPSEEFLCARCARHQKTCCQTPQVHVTLADVDRISKFTGRNDFAEYQPADDPDYLEQDDDPAWHQHVIRHDGSRRVIKHESNGDCTFLGPTGCTLPLETRPLVCRLYPYDYTESGLREELAPGCPLELLRPGQDLIGTLGMKVDDARRWHKQLYQEIQRGSENE